MTAYELVPKNHEAEQSLTHALQNTMFQNVHTFIGLFNSGFLNKNFEDTKKALELVKETYKNVSVSRGAITVHSHEEFMAEELADEFSKWKGLSRLRRELNTEINEGNLTHDTTLYLDKNGLVYSVDGDKIFTTRLVRVLKEAWPTILEASSINGRLDNHYDNEEYTLENPYEANDENEETEVEEDTTGKDLPENAQSRFFKPNDILHLDDSFIRDIYEIMEAR